MKAPDDMQVIALARAVRSLDDGDASILLADVARAARRMIADRGGNVALFNSIVDGDDAAQVIEADGQFAVWRGNDRIGPWYLHREAAMRMLEHARFHNTGG